MEKKLWFVRVLLVILIGWWMMTIFSFSAATGEESQSLSDKITIKVVKIIEPEYDNISPAEQEKLFGQVSFLVRKFGHFGEYGILGILISLLLITFETMKIHKLLIICVPTIVSLLYATTDEIHQGFVDGRSPKVLDVCIDTAGGFTGALFILIIVLLIIRGKNYARMGKKY